MKPGQYPRLPPFSKGPQLQARPASARLAGATNFQQVTHPTRSGLWTPVESTGLPMPEIVHPEPACAGRRSQGSLCISAPVCQCPLLSLCFQQLPTIKFHNSFVLITMQNARGVGGSSPSFSSSLTLTGHPRTPRIKKSLLLIPVLLCLLLAVTLSPAMVAQTSNQTSAG